MENPLFFCIKSCCRTRDNIVNKKMYNDMMLKILRHIFKGLYCVRWGNIYQKHFIHLDK